MKKVIKTTTTYEYDSERRVVKKIIEEVTEDVYEDNKFYPHYTTPIYYPNYRDYITCSTASDVNKYQE